MAEQLGQYCGRHYTTYIEEVRQLKRDHRLDDAEALLLEILRVMEEEARIRNWCVAPGWYEELAIVYRKQKRPEKELALLRRFAELQRPFWNVSPEQDPRPHRLLLRLAKLESKLQV